MLSSLLIFGCMFFSFTTTLALPSHLVNDRISADINGRSIILSTNASQHRDLRSVNASSSTSNPTPINATINLSYSPLCFPPPPAGREPYPIGDPHDCLEAIHKVISVMNPFQVVSWGISVNWIHDTCVVNLSHLTARVEFFSAADIAQEALRIYLECITQGHMFRGGTIRIGSGLNFMVVLGWRRIATPADTLEGSLANNSSSS